MLLCICAYLCVRVRQGIALLLPRVCLAEHSARTCAHHRIPTHLCKLLARGLFAPPEFDCAARDVNNLHKVSVCISHHGHGFFLLSVARQILSRCHSIARETRAHTEKSQGVVATRGNPFVRECTHTGFSINVRMLCARMARGHALSLGFWTSVYRKHTNRARGTDEACLLIKYAQARSTRNICA